LLPNNVGPNHCNLHLFEIYHGLRTLIQTLQLHIQISIIMVRHKLPSHQHFHFLSWCYWPFFIPPPTNHAIIPPNQYIIHKFNDYQFQVLHLQIAMTIKNPIHLFLSLQILFGIVFTLKSRYFLFDSIQITIYIIMSLKVTEVSLLAKLAPSFIPKIP
jgi:hypothetical protein